MLRVCSVSRGLFYWEGEFGIPRAEVLPILIGFEFNIESKQFERAEATEEEHWNQWRRRNKQNSSNLNWYIS